MASLIEQIQEEALDPDTSIADLLRKTKLAAVKLGVRETAEWVDHELSGYRDGPIPDYREVVGEPRYFDNFHGWFPILIDDEKMQGDLSVRRFGNPISEIEALCTRGDGQVHVPFPPGIVDLLQRLSGRSIRTAAMFISKSVLAAVLDAVRTRVLDWATELERAGVKGEGRMSFSKKDREVAAGMTFNMFGGSITGAFGPVSGGTINASTNITPEVMKTIESLADQAAQMVALMGLSAENRARLEELAAQLKQESARTAPSRSRLHEIMSSMATIAEQAAGNIVASGLLNMLPPLLAKLGG